MLYSLLLIVIGLSRLIKGMEWDFDKSIFCTGRLLHDVQTSGLFRSQRDFLELKLLKSKEVVEHRYKILRPKIKIHEEEGREKLKDFVRKHFDNVTTLERHLPSDWKARFSLLEAVTDENTKELLRKMNRNWIKYGRKMKKEVVENLKFFSHLPIRYPFFIDKGQNEMRYDELYWPFEALLASGMVSSAKNVLKNLFGLVDVIGHVPPESRVFFINRSSPPFLPIMLYGLYRKTGDVDFVRKYLRFAQLDFLHWFKDRSQIVSAAPFGDFLAVNEEKERLDKPRPEKYLQDVSWKKELEDENFAFVFWDSKPRSTISARSAAITERSAKILGELTQQFGTIEDSFIYSNISFAISKTIDRLLQNKYGWADFEPNRGQTGLTFWPALTGERPLNVTEILTPITAEENIVAVRVLLNSGKESEAKEIAQKWISAMNRQDAGLLETSITILMIAHFPDLKINPEENKRMELDPIYALSSFFLVLFNVYPTIEKIILALFL